MLKHILSATFLLTTSLAVSAEVTDPPSSNPPPEITAKGNLTSVPAVLGLIKESTAGAERVSDFCRLESTKSIPSTSIVVVVRKSPCTSRYGSSFNKNFLEVLYGGTLRLVPDDAVFLTDEEAKRFAMLEASQIDASIDDWKLTSLLARKNQLESALKSINSTSKYGITLLKSTIYDVSDYTEGTGFKATVYNPSKKTIKYVTFSVEGLNAVGDPVRGALKSSPVSILKGVGPIEPDETATYSKDYMWFTDIVESFRIRSIKVEYMDGSNKMITNMKNIKISDQHYELIMTD